MIITINNNNAPDSTKVDLQLVADGFVSPIGVVASPDNTGRLFVIDQAGKIWIIDRSGNKLSTPFHGCHLCDRFIECKL